MPFVQACPALSESSSVTLSPSRSIRGTVVRKSVVEDRISSRALNPNADLRVERTNVACDRNVRIADEIVEAAL